MEKRPSASDVLIKALEDQDPIVLFLGQDAWNDGRDGDPVLSAARKHLSIAGSATATWADLVSAMPLPDGFFRWLAERYSRTVPATWLPGVADLPWSAIFTSSFDSTLGTQFETPLRRPQTILTADESPTAARSLSRTPIYHLFGRAGQTDNRATAPDKRSSLRVRRAMDAVPMMNRIFDAATALGLLIVDGYTPSADWVTLDSLLAVIEQFPAQRVLWYGLKSDDPEISELIDQGRILAEPRRLSACLSELAVSGRMVDLAPRRSSETGVISYKSGGRTTVPPEMRIQVEAACHVIDDTWTGFLEPLGDDARYNAFRRFHGDVDGPRAMVNGVRRAFAITRDFEKELHTLVKGGVDGHARLRDPIIIHGQSATGKSIALARLISLVRDELAAAVLYSTSRVPQAFEVADFCEQAERTGALATIVICDCNAPINRYRDLLLGLRSRGRRVIVVGSSYRIVDSDEQQPREFIEVKSTLSDKERAALRDLVTGFAEYSGEKDVGHDRSVLGTLYRTLPSSRYRLSTGLGAEARSMEQSVRARAVVAVTDAPSLIAQKLMALGLGVTDTAALEEGLSSVVEADDVAGALVDLVMVAGQLNCAVPINLLMRAVSLSKDVTDLVTVSKMFRGLDLFRWQASDVRGEELLVSPRITLEAELLCRRRLLGPDAEAEKLIALIRATRLTWDYAGTERRFLIDLVQKLGPDGPMKTRYRASYIDIARTLTALRLDAGVDDPRLALQESVLRRSAIRENVVFGQSATGLLEEARDAVQSALDSIVGRLGKGTARARSNLIVERATLYGFLAVHEARNHASGDRVWSAYRAARVAAQTAIGTTDAYNPLDVALWTPADLLREDGLDNAQTLELHADIQSVLDRIDPDALPIDQRGRFYTRLHSLGGLLQMPELSESALQALDRENSSAGLFLRAREIGPRYVAGSAEPPDRQGALKAAGLLEKSWDRMSVDERCLRYLISCHWIAATGQWPLRGERKAIPANDDQRAAIGRALGALRELGVLDRDHGLAYLEAVFFWLGSDETHSLKLWRELSRATEFSDSRRVVRHLLITDESGRPQMFGGRVEAETEPGRFSVWVDALERHVQVLSRDFPFLDLAYGRTIPSFGVAFNYIGPIADPLHHEVSRS